MKWSIKHKSGRVLFVTSDEFIADNRRDMGWIVEEVKMTSRERFEKWFKARFNLGEQNLSEDDYGSDTAQTAWMAWQASRAELEVELPAWDEYDATWQYQEAAMDIIQSAGLKVKK